MKGILPQQRLICSISQVFVWLAAACVAGVSGGCGGGGETGLVLGRPLPQTGFSGSGPAAAAGSGGDVAGAPSSGAGGDAGASGSEDPSFVVDRCSPSVTYDNRDSTSTLFDDAVPSPGAAVRSATQHACRVLYRSGSEVKSVPSITLIIEDYAGVAAAGSASMRISSSYLQSAYDSGMDLPQEIAGILRFTTSLIYQNNSGGTAPGWLVTGIADFVRLRAGLLDPSLRDPGGSWDDSSQATAFFLDYLATRNPDVVYLLNQRLVPAAGAWTDDAFVDIMSSDLDTLWADYQATL